MPLTLPMRSQGPLYWLSTLFHPHLNVVCCYRRGHPTPVLMLAVIPRTGVEDGAFLRGAFLIDLIHENSSRHRSQRAPGPVVFIRNPPVVPASVTGRPRMKTPAEGKAAKRTTSRDGDGGRWMTERRQNYAALIHRIYGGCY